MITIGPPRAPSAFSIDDVHEVLPVVRRITRRAADRAVRVARRYGQLDRRDPEHAVLAAKIRRIIDAWANQIRKLGAQPRELWTVEFPAAGDGSEKGVVWQLAVKPVALEKAGAGRAASDI